MFEKIKNSTTKDIILAYFDSTKPVNQQVNLSTKRLGAVLLQDNKPIAFGNKSLTDIKSRYVNIEQQLWHLPLWFKLHHLNQCIWKTWLQLLPDYNECFFIYSHMMLPWSISLEKKYVSLMGYPGSHPKLRAWMGVFCSICQKTQKAQTWEPMIMTKIPLYPWHTVGTDLFSMEECPFVRKIPQNKNNSRTITELTKQIFSKHGVHSLQVKHTKSFPWNMASTTLHHALAFLGATDL